MRHFTRFSNPMDPWSLGFGIKVGEGGKGDLFLSFFFGRSWCLKMTVKVSLKIASEASYFCILSGQSSLKMVNFGDFLKTLSLLSNSVTRQVNFNKTKIFGKCQNWKTEMIFD